MLTTEQLKERKKGIGGSDVGAILGLNKYRSARDVWAEKTSDEIFENTDNKHIFFGNKAEPMIADVYAEKNNEKLEKPTKTYYHKDHAFLLANPDRLITGKKAVLECKTCSAYRRNEWGDEFSDQIPHEYLLQIAHYRYVMNLDYIDLMVLIDKDFLQYRYVRNADLEKKMIARLSNFWNENVLKGIAPPPIDRRDADAMPVSNESIEADEQLEKEIIELASLKKKSKEIEENIKKKEDSICSKVGSASIVTNNIGMQLCSYANVTSNRFDSSRFKQEKPQEYDQYLKQCKSRVLRVSSGILIGR